MEALRGYAAWTIDRHTIEFRERTVESTWRKYLDMASGLTEVPRRKAEDAVKALVARGEVAANASEHLVDSLGDRLVVQLVKENTAPLANAKKDLNAVDQ